MSTREPEQPAGDRTEFIDDAMDDHDEAGVTGDTAGSSAAHRSTATGPWWRRRPPAWVISAAAALVVGLVAGLLIGRGDPVTEAEQPSATKVSSSAQPPTVTTLAHIAPVQLIIPDIEVDASLVNLGLNADGTLEVPRDYAKAGWFTGGNYPGDPSGPPGLIAGHVDDYTGPAVFYDLKNLVEGNEIHVVRADNTVAVFVVTATAQYPKDEFPAAEVYAPVPDSEIVLVTCTGEFNSSARSYLDNFVVRARLDMARSLEESNVRVNEGITPPAVNQDNV